MIKETRITTIAQADDTDLRSLNLTIGNNQITTPVKITDPKTFYSNTIFPNNISSLIEVYLKFDRSSLEKMGTTPKYSQEKNRNVYSILQKGNNAPSLSIILFNSKDDVNSYPTELEVEQLVNLSYSFSDITPIPSLPNIARKIDINTFSNFMAYLETAIDTIEVRNKKSAIGYIPINIPPLFFPDLIDFYLDHGINAFFIDFDGTMITTHITSLNTIKRQIKKRGYEEQSFLHFVNVSYGKAINDVGVVAARDLLGFGFGLDSLGGIHQGPRRSAKFYEKLKLQKNVKTNSARILNRDDYGYYRVNQLGASLPQIYPQDAIIPLRDIEQANDSRIERSLKIVNNQQQCVEACALRTVIKESGKSSFKYFKGKKSLPEQDLKKLEKAHSS